MSRKCLKAFVAALVAAVLVVPAGAQVLSDAVQKAPSVDAALAAIGAKPERSGHLLLEMPEVVLPGKVRVAMGSEIAGTAWLVLLNGRRGLAPQRQVSVPGNPKPEPASPALIVALPFDAGVQARAVQTVEVQRSQFLTLLAFSRGRWYFVEREIKVAAKP